MPLSRNITLLLCAGLVTMISLSVNSCSLFLRPIEAKARNLKVIDLTSQALRVNHRFSSDKQLLHQVVPLGFFSARFTFKVQRADMPPTACAGATRRNMVDHRSIVERKETASTNVRGDAMRVFDVQHDRPMTLQRVCNLVLTVLKTKHTHTRA